MPRWLAGFTKHDAHTLLSISLLLSEDGKASNCFKEKRKTKKVRHFRAILIGARGELLEPIQQNKKDPCSMHATDINTSVLNCFYEPEPPFMHVSDWC
jgi:hypothetical protein